MGSKYTIADAVRMVGYLLEHHPTTHYWARTNKGTAVESNHPRASCWCLLGACQIVGNKLHLQYGDIVRTVFDDVLCMLPHGTLWDTHPNKPKLCKKLQEYKG
jgi:hypothetical protein